MLWAAASCATVCGPRGGVAIHAAFLVEAATKPEAYGKAMMIIERLYPSAGGFTDRKASVNCEVVDPDRPINPCALPAAIREAIGLPPDRAVPAAGGGA